MASLVTSSCCMLQIGWTDFNKAATLVYLAIGWRGSKCAVAVIIFYYKRAGSHERRGLRGLKYNKFPADCNKFPEKRP